MKIFIITMKDNFNPRWSDEVIQQGFKTEREAKEEIKKQEIVDRENGWDYSYFISQIEIEE